jgi:hypothetical protein
MLRVREAQRFISWEQSSMIGDGDSERRASKTHRTTRNKGRGGSGLVFQILGYNRHEVTELWPG